MRRCALGWIVVLLAVVLAASPIRSFAAEPAHPIYWIWSSKQALSGEEVGFRKSFEIKGDIKSAKLVATCDNHLTCYLNGQKLFTSDEWQDPVTYDLGKTLRQGKNVLAIHGKNDEGGSAAGLLVRLIVTMADGSRQVIVSDKSWKMQSGKTSGFEKSEFDDASWKPAVEEFPLGGGPWASAVASLDGTGRAAGKSAPGAATLPDAITALPGFQVELLYSVPKAEQGSWVNMTADPKGRLITSDQGGSLYRVTVGKTAADTKVEKIELNIGEAHGLLCAYDSLYVVVNGGKAQGSGLYRVRDTNGDDIYDEVVLMKKINGGGEHGPHAVRLGPDGLLYVMAGNHTKAPDGLDPQSPHRNWAEDLLLPRNPDGNGHATGVMAPGGWICRTDKDGKKWDIFCGGFRNSFDFDFNRHGEIFTYDADMEWDTGAPWYRPTRVNHCVSAAEFGWRYGTGKWPEYYADSLGAAANIGLGSPTGVAFGYGAKFPARYQECLLIHDWTYGKIYAVHLKEDGASYTGDFEVFVQGRPLPVTDLVVNTDGNLYFTIGGRGTQSGLYRVSYTGKESTAPAKPAADPAAAAARALRRQLEAFHGRRDEKAVPFAWNHLNSQDRYIRFAARVAVENQAPATWKSKALEEKRPTALIEAAMALARTGQADDKALQAQIVGRLASLQFSSLTEEQKLAVCRAYGLTFIRQGKPDASTAQATLAALDKQFPAPSDLVSRELLQVLVYLEAPGIVGRGMDQLKIAQTQQEQMFYVFVLRNAAKGWTLDQRKAYFSWIGLAETKYTGGASFKNFLKQIRKDASDKLSEQEKVALKEVIEGKQQVQVVQLETTRQFLHNWQMSDIEPMLDQVEKGRSFDKGKAAYLAAGCAKCHRFQGEGGATGPDITGVGARFNPQYLLEACILPSKVISDQYQQSLITTVDGEVFVGRVTDQNSERLIVRTDPFSLQTREIPLAKIDVRKPSPVSEMPQGLLNVLSKEEILDLIAYLRSAGDANDKAFKK